MFLGLQEAFLAAMIAETQTGGTLEALKAVTFSDEQRQNNLKYPYAALDWGGVPDLSWNFAKRPVEVTAANVVDVRLYMRGKKTLAESDAVLLKTLWDDEVEPHTGLIPAIVKIAMAGVKVGDKRWVASVGTKILAAKFTNEPFCVAASIALQFKRTQNVVLNY